MQFGSIFRLKRFATPSGTVPSDEAWLYFKADGNLYKKTGTTELAFQTQDQQLDTLWQNLANTVTTGALKWRMKNGTVFVSFVATAATASGTTYTVSTAQIPAEYRPNRNTRGACDFSGFPGTMLVLPSGNVQVAHNSGANRATVEGMVSYPVEVF